MTIEKTLLTNKTTSSNGDFVLIVLVIYGIFVIYVWIIMLRSSCRNQNEDEDLNFQNLSVISGGLHDHQDRRFTRHELRCLHTNSTWM